MPHRPPSPVRWEAARTNGALAVHGIVTGRDGATGTYRLEISKTSRSGTSRIAQSGAFDAKPGVGSTLGATTVDFAPETRVAVHLIIDTGSGAYTCDKEEVAP